MKSYRIRIRGYWSRWHLILSTASLCNLEPWCSQCSAAPRITAAAAAAAAAGEDRESAESRHWADDVNGAAHLLSIVLLRWCHRTYWAPARQFAIYSPVGAVSHHRHRRLYLSIRCNGSWTVSKPVVVLDWVKSPSGMTWSRHTSAERIGAAALPSFPAPTTVRPKRSSSRRMVGVVAVCVVILVSFTDVVMHADGFVVEPASSSASFQRHLNDSAKPSRTG